MVIHMNIACESQIDQTSYMRVLRKMETSIEYVHRKQTKMSWEVEREELANEYRLISTQYVHPVTPPITQPDTPPALYSYPPAGKVDVNQRVNTNPELTGNTVTVIRKWSTGYYQIICNGKLLKIKNINKLFTNFRYQK